MNTIDTTLTERGTRYGEFPKHAAITQGIKSVMQRTPNWEKLHHDQKEALEMVAHKVGRILNGDPNYIDSWHDIIGYTRLVEQRLEKEQATQKTSAFDPNRATTFGPLKAPGTDPSSAAPNGVGAERPRADACNCPVCTLEALLKDRFEKADVPRA